MHAPPPGPRRIPGYNLALPGEPDAVAALERVFGPEQGAARWTAACRAAGVFVGRVRDSEQLARATAELAAQGGAAASVARSIEIRLRTHARLAARAAATGQGAAQ